MQNFTPLAFSAVEKSVTVRNDKQTNKQVRQQACQTQIPPYGLKQRRSPQFRIPMPCSDLLDPPEPLIPEVMPPLP